MGYTPFVVSWAALAVVVAFLMVRRVVLGFGEDDTLHLRAAEAGMERQQVDRAVKINSTDRWGQTLTAVTVVYGLILAAVFIWRQLQ